MCWVYFIKIHPGCLNDLASSLYQEGANKTALKGCCEDSDKKSSGQNLGEGLAHRN